MSVLLNRSVEWRRATSDLPGQERSEHLDRTVQTSRTSQQNAAVTLDRYHPLGFDSQGDRLLRKGTRSRSRLEIGLQKCSLRPPFQRGMNLQGPGPRESWKTIFVVLVAAGVHLKTGIR